MRIFFTARYERLYKILSVYCVGEELRFQTERRKRIVDAAPALRIVQEIACIELQSRHIRIYVHLYAVSHCGCRIFPVQCKVMVIAAVRKFNLFVSVADILSYPLEIPEVERRACHIFHLSRWQTMCIYRSIGTGIYPKKRIANGGVCPAQVKKAMVRGRPERIARAICKVCNAKRIAFDGIHDAHYEICGHALVAVLAEKGEHDFALAVVLAIKRPLIEALKAAVQRVFAIVAVKPVFPAVQNERTARYAVCNPAYRRTEIVIRGDISVHGVVPENKFLSVEPDTLYGCAVVYYSHFKSFACYGVGTYLSSADKPE